MHRTLTSIFLVLCGLLAAETPAQIHPPVDPGRSAALKLYLDSGTVYYSYLLSEINFVNFLRERDDADVHVIVTGESTGGGGTEYVISFAGKGLFSDLNYTLKSSSPANSSEESLRKSVSDCLKKGLMPFISRTPLAEKVRISSPSSGLMTSPMDDPWDSWVFAVSLSGTTEGEKTSKSYKTSGNFDAQRITRENKTLMNYVIVDIYKEYDIGESSFDNLSKERAASASYVWSLGEHYGAGVFGNWGESTSDNILSLYKGGFGVEYNLYPYREYSSHEISFQYQIFHSRYSFHETTIFGVMEENLWQQCVTASAIFRKEWGSMDASLAYKSYLEDRELYSLKFSTKVAILAGKGFSFDISASYSMIHDQIYISGEGATTEEILLKLKALETDYRFSVYAGITYTFGSIYNNVVNTRF